LSHYWLYAAAYGPQGIPVHGSAELTRRQWCLARLLATEAMYRSRLCNLLDGGFGLGCARLPASVVDPCNKAMPRGNPRPCRRRCIREFLSVNFG
jgi:hypothetical protein